MSAKRKSGNPLVDLSAGGIAGCCEALACHPLDTIKVRMQLEGKKISIARKNVEKAVEKARFNHEISATNTIQKVREAAERQFPTQRRGFVATGAHVFRKDGFPGLYKGLSVVIAGITPKMAIRFWSFEELKRLLAPTDGKITPPRIFAAGIGAGIVEAIMVVNPTEVIKIRMQTQSHSLSDPTAVVRPPYRNAWHCLVSTIRQEGIGAIYRGVGLTAARQATNQGTNFTAYSLIRAKLNELQPQFNGDLPGWQTSLIGLTSGALGPFSNAPLDVIKTRVQREGSINGESGFAQGLRIARDLVRNEGTLSLWRGITPRVMRVAPGQAVTFTVYELARKRLESAFRPTLQ